MNYYPKHGQVEVDGRLYDYTIDKISNMEYSCVVPDCKEACVIKPYEIEEYHIKTYIHQTKNFRTGSEKSE